MAAPDCGGGVESVVYNCIVFAWRIITYLAVQSTVTWRHYSGSVTAVSCILRQIWNPQCFTDWHHEPVRYVIVNSVCWLLVASSFMAKSVKRKVMKASWFACSYSGYLNQTSPQRSVESRDKKSWWLAWNLNNDNSIYGDFALNLKCIMCELLHGTVTI